MTAEQLTRPVLEIDVNNHPGVMSHVVGLFSRRAYNVEGIICVKTIQEGFITPTINLRVPDPECDLDYVPNTGRAADVKYAISNSFGFGGHNATLVFKRYEG